jgi:hypothetical protein
MTEYSLIWPLCLRAVPAASPRASGAHTRTLLALVILCSSGFGSTPAFAQGGATTATARPDASVRDSLFTQPYTDVDEWRDTPVRHRYVHGGFRGTETRFSFYFPPASQYGRRFFQHITPVPDNENLAQRAPLGEENKIGFSIASGAYFVETNGGGTFAPGRSTGVAPTITAYRANAATAQYSRVIAAKIYGPHRPYGYAFGGSGGAYRTIGSIENTRGVWDGAVPYVVGSTMALPNVFSVRMHAMRTLKDRFPQIVDALEPGGSGDPYEGLNEEEQGALREATRMGFPLPSWFGYKTMGIQAFGVLYQGVVNSDPGYFANFWTAPGYLGANPPASLLRARVQYASTVTAVVSALDAAQSGITRVEAKGGVDDAFEALRGEAGRRTVGFRLASAPPAADFLGGDLIVKTGAAAGQRVPIDRISGRVVVLGFADPSVAAKLAPGDSVVVDNSNFLAAQTYHRHQVPGLEFHAWDQFRGPDGKPIYPQRPMLLGPLFVQATAGSLQTGRFEGKMIVLESLWDREAFPWQADWYRARVKEHFGEKLDDHFRLYYTDHALHGDVSWQEDPTHTVSYIGVLHQALRDLSAWVERGVAPPASTSYRIVDDAQVVVPPTAAARKGIQPVVSLRANGVTRSEVAVGTPVSFVAVAEVPPGAGKLVAAQWDMEGAGTFPLEARARSTSRGRWELRTSFTFRKPGTYFPTVRVISQREGDASTPYARIQNLGRVRVVVR